MTTTGGKINYESYECFGFYIPTRMMGGLKRWIENGIKPGHFLSAVLKNDLMEALGRADDENRKNLPVYGYFLYNKAPYGCFGSEDKFNSWKEKGGLKGKEAK